MSNHKKFDLNIEKILENWDVKHAIREIIANAIDEQKLSHTLDIRIYRLDTEWIIKDYGRGLRPEHFTQNENKEKLSSEGVIGKFGIGLKDALATFDRKGVLVSIYSKYGDFTLEMACKAGFEKLRTLHVRVSSPSFPTMSGTEFHLRNISDSDMNEAKGFFLIFNEENTIEQTRYGGVLLKKGDKGKIYINGVLVAEEDNFLFSYNITAITPSLRKALNRERTNVGRTAYAGIVRNILLQCGSEDVGKMLSEDLGRYSYGNNHDELKWIDVQNHAATILNKYKKVVFVTPEEIQNKTDLIDEAKEGGREVVIIPTNLRSKIEEDNKSRDTSSQVSTISNFIEERSKNFEFKFIEPCRLSAEELSVFMMQDWIFKAIGGKPSNVREILISETMQTDSYSFRPAEGLWQGGEQQIIILRSTLKNPSRFLGVLLHELAHAASGATDATRLFESTLTEYLGKVAYAGLMKM